MQLVLRREKGRCGRAEEGLLRCIEWMRNRRKGRWYMRQCGGLMMGIGQALLEETVIDHHYGRMVNQDLAEYHMAVHADTPQFEHIFVDEHVNPIGVKGLGEIAMVGIAPAIANAVFHATGKRIRDLPIRLDKLL